MKKKSALQTTEKNQTVSPKSKLRENAEAIVIAIVLALFIRAFVVQAFKIPSGSMKDTLLIGDHILVNKFIYGVTLPFVGTRIIPVSDPQRGDIIVFRYPEDPDKDFIKRLIAVPGDTVEIRNKKVYVNHQPISADACKYTDPRVLDGDINPRDNLKPLTVPSDGYFVMGDNRDNSYDSRFWGFVSRKAIKGKAFIIYWSWDSEDFGVRWKRIGSILK
ncbi:MAG: signal peptidase I [Desulfobacterales bacterium CG23_combo_of_CG06-09_8_20_14_all_51_8]|nr:MAG: signal peptidase I [Desulfobacterales bacterium CG23_combo_of_CG06-09_8_20_14_all_51_8]